MQRANRNGQTRSRRFSWRSVLVGTALFLFVFLCYVINKPGFDFIDELDVFEGGALAWRGGDVYKGMMSQHMPFSYYFAIIPAMLGAKTMDQYRLGLYMLLSLLWVGNWIHQRKHLPQVMLLSIPFLYLGQLNLVTMGTVMISDHWQGIGMAILLEEMLRYDETGRISLSSALWISGAIVLSFGTAFVAAYGVACVAVCVAVMQLSRYLRAEKTARKELGRTLLQDDLRLVVICVAPFALLLLWYLVSGNLQNFIDYCYTINIETYSQYMGGFGTDPGGTFFKMFADYFEAMYWVLPNFFELKSPVALLLNTYQMLRFLSVFGLAGVMVKRKRYVMGLSVVLVAIMSSPRGATRDSYHTLALYCVSTVCMGWWLAWAASRWRKGAPGKAACCAALACAALVMAPVAQDLPRMPSVRAILTAPVHNLAASCVSEIAQPGDEIQSLSMGDCDVPIMTDLTLGAYSGAATTPWTYEFRDAGVKQLEHIREDHPRFILYQPDMRVWGYETDVYAAETVAYVREHYENLCWNLYVPKEEYEAIWRTLTERGYILGTQGESTGRGVTLGEMLCPGETVTQTLVSQGGWCVGVEVYLATYYGTCPAGVTVTLTDLTDGTLVSQAHVDKADLYDNRYSIAPCGAMLAAGHTYEIAITADDGVGDTRIVPYFTDTPCNGDVYAVVRGERTAQCLAVQLRYLPAFAAP